MSSLITAMRIQPPTPEERFWDRVAKNDSGCWLWRGGKPTKYGYGVWSYKGILWQAHRVAFALVHGEPPRVLVIDHLCRNKLCVNPSHLEAVEPKENVRRGNAGKHLAAKTICPNGHAYNQSNTRSHQGRRICRLCDRRRRPKVGNVHLVVPTRTLRFVMNLMSIHGSQIKVGVVIGVHQSTISRILKGRKIYVKTDKAILNCAENTVWQRAA